MIPTVKVLAITATLFTLISGALHGDLSFPKKKVTKSVLPSDDSFAVSFQFKNNGKRSIAISEVESNCGCLRAETDKQIYAKGESGTVTAEFLLAGVEGKQTKQIWVMYTDDQPVVRPKIAKAKVLARPEGELGYVPLLSQRLVPMQRSAPKITSDRLTVEVDVPVLITVNPKITTWGQGSDPKSRIVKLSVLQKSPIHIKEVTSSQDNVVVDFKEILAGWEYELALRPTSTDQFQLGMVNIFTDSEFKNHQKKQAFFAIERSIDFAPELKAISVMEDEVASEGTLVSGHASETIADLHGGDS